MKKLFVTNRTFRTLAFAFIYVIPLSVHAETFGQLVSKLVSELVNPIIALLAGIAIILFFWGLVQFIAGAGNPTKLEEGKQRMLWGIVALFVMFSFWGIVLILQNTVFTDSPNRILRGVL